MIFCKKNTHSKQTAIKMQMPYFLCLLRGGLWGELPDPTLDWQAADWQVILRLAHTQGVEGQICDGILLLPKNYRPPKQRYINMLLRVKSMEEDSTRYLKTAVRIQEALRSGGVRSFVLKGVGMARHYANPLHRASGDIDLLIKPDGEQMDTALQILRQEASADTLPIHENNEILFNVGGILVELHTKVVCDLNRITRRHINSWTWALLDGGALSWKCRAGTLTLPPYQFDVLYIWLHFFRHYIVGACSLKQVCDWVMLIYRCESKIDTVRLRADLQYFRLLHPWQVFASVAVCIFGLPAEKMPLYDAAYDTKGATVFEAVVHANAVYGDLMDSKEHVTSSLRQHWNSFRSFLPIYRRNFCLFPRCTAYNVLIYVLVVLRRVLKR